MKALPAWAPWALASAFCAGLTAVLAKAGVAAVPSNLATAIRTGVILLFSWSLVAWTGEGRGLLAIAPGAWWCLVLSGLTTGASWLCYFRALQLGEASRVAPVDKLSVVFAVALAALLLGERLSGRQLIGAALILAGAILMALKPS